MDARDVILSALKPGTPLNPKSKEYRSMAVLTALTGLPADEVQSLLLGDLAQEVHVKPSPTKGWLVRLRPPEVQAQAVALAGAVAAQAEEELETVANVAAEAVTKIEVPMSAVDAKDWQVDAFVGEDDEDDGIDEEE